MNLVQKYGGDYLKDASDLTAIADYVTRSRKEGDQLILVVAALQEIAKPMTERMNEMGLGEEISKGKLDLLFSTAEQQTALLLAAALEKNGLPAWAIDSIRGESLTNIEKEDGKHELIMDEIVSTLASGRIPVIAGYQGIGTYHAEDARGRYGAAATAVAVAAEFGWDCELYGNTKGIYTKPDGSKMIPAISYEEAMEIIQLSDCDLESRAIELAGTYGVRVFVGEAFDDRKEKGTYIMDRSLIIQEGAITGITVSDDIAVYTLGKIPADGESVAEIFEVLGDLGVNIDMISQQADSETTSTISFSCGKDRIEEIDNAFAINPRLYGLEISKRDDLSLISLVGVGMASHVGVACKVFGTLAAHQIPHYHITSSEISISTTIDTARKAEAVVALGETFHL